MSVALPMLTFKLAKGVMFCLSDIKEGRCAGIGEFRDENQSPLKVDRKNILLAFSTATGHDVGSVRRKSRIDSSKTSHNQSQSRPYEILPLFTGLSSSASSTAFFFLFAPVPFTTAPFTALAPVAPGVFACDPDAGVAAKLRLDVGVPLMVGAGESRELEADEREKMRSVSVTPPLRRVAVPPVGPLVDGPEVPLM